MNKGMAFVNGEFQPPEHATISVFDLGFTRSDAVYDVTSVWKGLFFRLPDHIARFRASCEGVHLPCPYDDDQIARIVAECVHRSELDDAYVAMVVTRGRFRDPTRRDIAATTPTFIAYAVPYVWILDPEICQRGIDLAIAATPRIPDPSVDQRFKNYHWGDLTRGLFESRAVGADTTVLCTQDGTLAEGPGFNLFFVSDGVLCTPDRNILHGITRRSVIELAEEIGIRVAPGAYHADDLRNADEAFVSSTAGGVIPIRRVDNRSLSNRAPGALSTKMRDLYWRKREAGWHGRRVAEILGVTAEAS